VRRIPEEQLERELRAALGRQDPTHGFAESVLRRAENQSWWERLAPRSLFQSPLTRWAVVAVLCVMAGVGYEAYRREQRRAGEEAKRQVMLALRITGAKLRHAESRVQKIRHDDQD
jgi:hypothetical protein